MLFRNKKDMKIYFCIRTPDTVGELGLGYQVVSHESTSSMTTWDYSVAKAPGSYDSLGCLELRLKLSNDQNAIFTTTHAFVQLATLKAYLRMKLVDWYLRAWNALTGFFFLRTNPEIPAVENVRQSRQK
jgi:hypothetical protein